MIIYLPIGLIVLVLFLVLFPGSKVQIRSLHTPACRIHTIELRTFWQWIGITFEFAERRSVLILKLGNRSLVCHSMERERIKKEKTKGAEKLKTRGAIPRWVMHLVPCGEASVFRLKDHLFAIGRSFQNPRFSGEIQVGFTSPMYTGWVFGGFAVAAGIWPWLGRNVVLTPVFASEMMAWDLSFAAGFIPARLIWRSILFWYAFRKINL